LREGVYTQPIYLKIPRFATIDNLSENDWLRNMEKIILSRVQSIAG
jgi:hypothetical protein